MAERTMEELLCATTEGYGEAIVLPEINVDHFEIKTNLLQLVQANPFHGYKRGNPRAYINSFKWITSTLLFRDVPNDVIKLMMFPYLLEGNARLCEAWERFKEMLRACPHHGFTMLTQVDTFYNGLNENDQDSLNAAVGGNVLSKTTREALNIIENKSKVCYSHNKLNVSKMNTTSRERVSKTDERIDKLADQISTLVEIVSKKVVTPAPVKAVEEICVTCSGPHAWYNCPNTDNNQASVCAATGSYNQVNPPNRVSNQMAPPGFAPVQNNGQNRFNQNQGQGNNFNRGNNFHGNQGFQAQNNHAPNFQNQGFQNQPFQVPNNQVQQEFSNEFSTYKRTNDQMMRNKQNQINSLKGDFKNKIQNTMMTQQAVMMNQQTTFQNNLQNMIGGLFQNHASTSGTLPSNTIPNPKGEMKAITTRSGVAYEGPSIPTNPSPKKVVERETEKTTDKEQSNFQGSTAQIPPPVTPIPTPEPDVPKNLPKTTPIPSRRNDQKSRDKASNQMEKIFQIFQDLRFDISFADALLLMPRFAPTIKSLLMNKEKLLELAKIPLNENCSAMLLKKLPEKLGDPDKFLIPCNFPRMDLSLHELTPTRMTLELADRSITRPKGVAEDVFVKVGSFHFPTDFVVVDFEADPRFPLILGDSFGEVLRLKKSNHFLSSSLTSFETSDSLLEEFADELALLDPFPPGNKDVDVEAELKEIELLFNRYPSTIFSPRITFDPDLERFTNEPSLVCLPPPGDECECNEPDSQTINFLTFSNPLFNDSASSNDESSHEEVTHEMSFITYSNPLFNLDEEIISSKFNPIHNEVLDSIPKNDHFDAKSYLPESPLNHDTLTVFSPRNDPLHHEFAGEIITPPPRIVREHEEYISRMWLLCGNSSSRSPENFHASPNTIIESLPIFPIPVQDSDSHREEIDIFPGPDDLMPPDIKEDECFDPGGDNDEIDAFLAIEVPTYIEEGYYDSEGDVFYLEKLLIDDTTHNLFPEVLFDHEPQCFKDESELDTLENMVKVFDPGIWEKTFSLSCVRLSSKDHHYLLFTIVVQILCTRHMKFLFSFGSEDTIFDPGIYAFHFSSQELVAVKCLMEVCTNIAKITKKCQNRANSTGNGTDRGQQDAVEVVLANGPLKLTMSAHGEDGSGLSNPDLVLTALSLSDGSEKQQSDHQGPTFRPLNLHLRDSGYVENVIPNDSTIKSKTLLEGQKQDLHEGSDVQESKSKRQTTLIFRITNPLMHVSNKKADEMMLDSKFQALVAEDFIIANVKNVINKLGRLTIQVTIKIPQLATESLDATHPQLIDDSLDAKLHQLVKKSLKPIKFQNVLKPILRDIKVLDDNTTTCFSIQRKALKFVVRKRVNQRWSESTIKVEATNNLLLQLLTMFEKILRRPFKSPTTLDEINAKVDDINANLEKLVQTLIEIMTSTTSFFSVPVEGMSINQTWIRIHHSLMTLLTHYMR
ncbi:hypothetical protein Tco_0575856 [Tanacetum coccineum]